LYFCPLNDINNLFIYSMKRLVFTLAMSLIVCVSFGQKKAVSSAKNEIKGGAPNFEEARKLIKEAQVNQETEAQAETWFVAGQIENKQLDTENMKEILGQDPNRTIMYTALSNIYPYFEKAYELDQLPDEKGKVKPKFTKDIRSLMKANRVHYFNAGVYYYDNKDYQQAYDNFKMYGDISTLPMMSREDFPQNANDSTEMQVRFYAGMAASLIPNHDDAIAIYSELKDKGYADAELYQRLVYEYEQVSDSVSLVNILKEGMVKFPENDFFLLNLINININTENTSQAIIYLNEAIAKNPANAQLYDVLGQVYEIEKNYDKAFENLKKALEIDPNNADYLSHTGKVYYNLGVETRGNADNIAEKQQYEQEFQKAQSYFKEAIPYFEKAYELNPDDSNAIFALRSIYYNLGMGEEFDKMDAIYNGR
jgi:Cytochrome c biogenesis factor